MNRFRFIASCLKHEVIIIAHSLKKDQRISSCLCSVDDRCRITESEPQNLANIAWSLATISWYNEPLVGSMAEQCVCIAKQFGPQDAGLFCGRFVEKDGNVSAVYQWVAC